MLIQDFCISNVPTINYKGCQEAMKSCVLNGEPRVYETKEDIKNLMDNMYWCEDVVF